MRDRMNGKEGGEGRKKGGKEGRKEGRKEGKRDSRSSPMVPQYPSSTLCPTWLIYAKSHLSFYTLTPNWMEKTLLNFWPPN